jgi:hypothetical protein
MLTIVLAIALLAALIGLGFEIGIASWNIRRATRYRRREAAAEHATEQAVALRKDMAGRMESLDRYAADISWLLNFLYKRYDSFADLEKEVSEGLKGVTGDTPIGESDAKYKDLKKALKLVRVTVKASERMENLMNSITAQLSQIAEDFQCEDECEKLLSEEPAEEEKEEETAADPESGQT